MVEGKLVLVGYDELPLKPMNVDGETKFMDPFPCLSDTFGAPNTTTIVAMAGTSDTPSNNREDDLLLEDKECYENSVYGFFLSKRVVYPVVENYVKNVWSRFGLVRTMINLKDMASSSGTKIVTLNPFDVLNMVDKDIRDAPSDTVNSKADDVNVGNIKVISWIMRTWIAIMTWKRMIMKQQFMALKSSKGTGS
ncbi:hypothetical protein Tco_0060240 [Tanacetum coccineum]